MNTMKIKKFLHPHLLLFLLTGILFSGCFLFEEENNEPEIPDNWLEHSYLGTLTVQYTNTYPEWNESAVMDVDIDKQTGLINFSGTILSFSGETLISVDSKITRSGSWNINPLGLLINDEGTVYVQVDAQVVVNSEYRSYMLKPVTGNGNL